MLIESLNIVHKKCTLKDLLYLVPNCFENNPM